LKISIITISLNNHSVISQTIESVILQTFKNIEYIVIDGGSTDGSVEIISSFESKINCFITETDMGIYNAINKGITLANGDIIGLLHAGDVFYDAQVLSKVHASFVTNDAEIIYGHSIVLNKNRNKIVRRNISPKYKDNLLKFGWFPSHQATFYKSSVFSKYGLYDERYNIAADYEFLLRMLYVHKLRPIMVDFFVLKFFLGGKSSKSVFNVLESNVEVYKAWKKNNLGIPFYTIPLKLLRKLSQKIMFFLNE